MAFLRQLYNLAATGDVIEWTDDKTMCVKCLNSFIVTIYDGTNVKDKKNALQQRLKRLGIIMKTRTNGINVNLTFKEGGEADKYLVRKHPELLPKDARGGDRKSQKKHHSKAGKVQQSEISKSTEERKEAHTENVNKCEQLCVEKKGKRQPMDQEYGGLHHEDLEEDLQSMELDELSVQIECTMDEMDTEDIFNEITEILNSSPVPQPPI